MEPEIVMSVGIVLERRKSKHPWADYAWQVVAVVPEMPVTDGWQHAQSDGESDLFQFSPATLTLHRRMGEAYDANIGTDKPALWVLLDEDDTEPVPYKLRGVTADPYEAQGFLDSAEGLAERVVMPPDVAAWMAAYLKQMPEPEQFRKRRRVPLEIEEARFGKDPIFAPGGKRPAGGEV